MNPFRLLLVFLRLGMLNELAYRANFFVQLFQSALELGGSLIALAVVFSHTDNLAGWTHAELRALLGVFFLVGGVIKLVIQPSMYRFMTDVRQGTLDFTLIKPEDAQLLVSLRQVEIWKATDILLGTGLLVASLLQLGADVGAVRALQFVAAITAGGAIVYSFWLMLATLSFWFVKLDNILVVFQSMYEAGRWPLTIYPRWLRTALTFVVPVAFAVTVPAQALVGRLEWQELILALVAAVFMLAVSRWFWVLGLRRYSGASA